MSDSTEADWPGMCWSYCEHGGVCELDKGHPGLHDSSYCQWDDDHALSKEDADAVFRTKDPAADGIIAVTDALRALGDAS